MRGERDVIAIMIDSFFHVKSGAVVSGQRDFRWSSWRQGLSPSQLVALGEG
jgi:hypothetical protein